MTTGRTLDTLTSDDFESRLRSLAEGVAGAAGVDDLEMKHLLEILTRSSLLLRDVFNERTLDEIFEGERQPASLLGADFRPGAGLPEERLLHLWKVPDTLRTYGDKCLYDIGLAGLTSYRGVALQELGPRAYHLTSRVLEFLAEDRNLREFYEHNLIERLPIEEEILFLRQCASRFKLYSQILQAFRADDLGGVKSSSRHLPETVPDPVGRGPGSEALVESRPAGPADGPAGDPEPVPAPAAVGRRRLDDEGGLDRVDRLTRFERALLFSSLDLSALRTGLSRVVVDQPDAVDRLCDDLGVHALGTRGHARPQSYFLVGPTGVGKNYLMESVASLLESTWGVEVPFMVLEGAQYTHPSDVSELKGSTRGYIRSDEEGLLSEFHQRARRAPLSILLIDEVEKAHPQLARCFLSLMDRGATMDNRGRLLRFPATILAFTSNLGYSDPEMRVRPIGYERRRSGDFHRQSAARLVRRGLPPEFLNRLQVIQFAALSRGSAVRIVDQEIDRIVERYRSLHGIELRVTAAARRRLVAEGFSEEYGARHLVATVDRECNVEVSLRLHAGAAPLTERAHGLLERIREARSGERGIDERALRNEVESEIGLRHGVRRITVDRKGKKFTYRVDKG